MTETQPAIRAIAPLALEPAAFAPFGQVIAPMEDGVPFGPHDAQIELSRGTPRFYIMRLPRMGLRFTRITRHRQVTQCLASVGGRPWYIAVAPPGDVDDPGARPALEGIAAFRIPGDSAIMLHRGTWHAGPFFDEAEIAFFNLELADTNQVDHHSCELDRVYGTVLEFAV